MKNRRLSSQTLYEGRIIRLRLDEIKLPDGRPAQREIIEHPGAAAIVPLDAAGNVHLVRQYRDAVDEQLLEIPAGKLKPGEDPADCARRELREELGLAAGRLAYLASFYSTPGFCNEIMHLYLAEELTASTDGTNGEEFIEKYEYPLLPLAPLLALFKDAKSIAGIMLTSELLGRRDRGS